MRFWPRTVSLLIILAVIVSKATSKPSKRSLGFVIDTTASMSSDIRQVGKGISHLIQHHWEETTSIFSNFIVSPFNDPDVGPITNTSDAEKLYNHVTRLQAQGGGDCPEKVFTGLIAAINYSLPHSLLLVFTDGLAKDKGKMMALRDAARKKDVVIVTVMTGCCHYNPCPAKDYNEIAKMTNGAFYRIAKDNVHYVMQFIVAAIEKDVSKLQNPPKRFNDLLLFISQTKKIIRQDAIESVIKKECHVPSSKGLTSAQIFLIGCTRVRCTATGVKVVEMRCDAGNGSRDCKKINDTWNCTIDGRKTKCICQKDNIGVFVKVI